ncbi:unnamed protein product [Ixodes persulcatus]
MFLGCWGIPRPRQCQRRCTPTSLVFLEQKFVGQWDTIALSGFVGIALSFASHVLPICEQKVRCIWPSE